MRLIADNIKWIMLVTGMLTCTILYAVLAPRAALQAMFGESLEGPLAEVIVRNWGALITISGMMLIYGAYNPPSRPLVLVVAGASKLVFSALVLGKGKRYLRRQAMIAVAGDVLMVVIFTAYLFT